MSGWLLVLTSFLLVWMPLTLSRELAVTLPSIGMRGWGAVIELAAHALVAAFTVAAGWALAVRNPRAPMFGIVALAGSAGVSVQSLYWSVLPRQTLPDDRIILAGAAIVHAAAWIAYLRRSRRVRALYD